MSVPTAARVASATRMVRVASSVDLVAGRAGAADRGHRFLARLRRRLGRGAGRGDRCRRGAVRRGRRRQPDGVRQGTADAGAWARGRSRCRSDEPVPRAGRESRPARTDGRRCGTRPRCRANGCRGRVRNSTLPAPSRASCGRRRSWSRARGPTGRPAGMPSTTVPVFDPRSSTVTVPGRPGAWLGHGHHAVPARHLGVRHRQVAVGRHGRGGGCPATGATPAPGPVRPARAGCLRAAGGGLRPRRSPARLRARPAAVDYRGAGRVGSIGMHGHRGSVGRGVRIDRSAGCDRTAESCSVDLPGDGARKALDEGHRTRPERLGESTGRVVEQLLRERRTGHRRGDGGRRRRAGRVRPPDPAAGSPRSPAPGGGWRGPPPAPAARSAGRTT